jgi:hypothetical protein
MKRTFGLFALFAFTVGCASGESGGAAPPGDSGVTTDGGDAAPPDATSDGVAPDASADAAEDAAEDAPDGGTADAPPDVACPSGTKPCGSACVAEDDPAYGCAPGSCDPCQLANATAVCVAGVCTPQSCDLGYGDCNANPADGCEVDLLQDTAHCGGCGNFCVVPNATAACNAGACGIAACNSGFADCDPSAANGCEANILLDPSHCGGCGTLCQPVGGSACANGVCQFTGCPTGKGNCDGIPDNGCEVDLTNSNQHCGFCGNACSLPNAVAQCVASKCEIASCNAGYADCDGLDANGCEVQVQTSVSHCGSCNGACSTTNNTSQACGSGLCSYTCNPGFSDCNGPQPGASDDGCETVTSSDVNNCGSCGKQCQNAHGFTACVNAVCSPSCATGWGNCNGNPDDGCETSTTTTSNCGTCGKQCANPHGTTSCTTGSCVPTCTAGWGNCNGNPDDGCETSTTTTSNCGVCGKQCTNSHGTTTCTGGACVPTCSSGWANCSNPDDGCETNVALDPQNCGTCGKSCAAPNAQTTCVSGGCAIVSCSPQYYDLNGNPADGCEYQCAYATPGPETCDGTDEDCDGQIDEDFDLQSDPNNCGNCGTTCGSATGGLCCAGICKSSDPQNCGACGQVCTPGMLLINELMIDPGLVADSQGEWFELRNPNAFGVDVRGFVIQDLGTDSHAITSSVPIVVPPLGYVVLGNNANTATNGGVSVQYQYGTFFMGNSGDELLVIAHGVELDRVVWTGTFDVLGKSKELSKNHQSITLNDNLANWCTAVATYGLGDFGTPGAANDCAL